MDMDTQALRWFQQVADGVTVTEVSDLERTTQSGVSRALARLEAEVGTPLLRRSGRTLRMTHAGVAFKHHVDALMHQLDDGMAAVHELVDPETGTVTLAFQPSLGTWLVPDLVGAFRSHHPRVRFDLRPKRDEQVSAEGPRSAVDLELSTLRPPAGGLPWRRLTREPLRLVVPAGHHLAGRGPIALEDVVDEPFVSLRSTSLLRRTSDELCAAAGFTPALAFECDDLPTLRGFVAAGLGVALVPAPRETGAGPVAAGLRHLDVTDAGAVREVGLSWSPDRRLLASAELFRAHVLQRAADRLLPRLAGTSR